MKRKIPSTQALVAFEAAARHGSFARAASELCLTESAVSRQISSLENYLDTQLFARVRRQVVLNDAGRIYAKHITRALRDLEGHTLSLMSKKQDNEVLELAVLPTFAHRWLLPRLRDFHAHYPQITVNLTEKTVPFLFNDSQCDAALHSDHPAWTGVTKIDLFEERLVPVINPHYFDTSRLKNPQDLMSMPLLYKATRLDAWWHWFELAGCASYGVANLGMRFDLYGMVIDAAISGLGAALVPRFYVEKEIRQGDLEIPFNIELCHEKRYCLVYPEHKQDLFAVAAFRSWIIQEKERFDSSWTNLQTSPTAPTSYVQEHDPVALQ